MHVNVLGNRKDRGLGETGNQQFQEFPDFSFPARPQATKTRRSEVENTDVRPAALVENWMLQRLFYIGSGADAKKSKGRR